MKQIYDYNSNRLYFERKSGLKYSLDLRGNITIVDGLSATGKTLLYNELKAIKDLDSKISGYDVSNIVLFSGTDEKEFSVVDENILVIIDEAEKVLDDNICKIITKCNNARFLIFTRLAYNLYVSPNHFGTFVEKDNMISIYYEYNERSWG